MSFTTFSLAINSVAVPASQIAGSVVISRRENEAASMVITLITGTGTQDLSSWAGKSITLDIDSVRAFTGVIDIPEIDLVGKRITLLCTDRRREILNAQAVTGVGYYSSAIFPDVDNTIDELEQRLETTPSAADIKPDGSYAITSQLPKSVADITLTNADVYRRNPTVTPTARGRLVNQVNLTFKHRYTRLRHRERTFQIGDNTFCEYSAQLGAVFTSKKQFLEYIKSMQWLAKESTISFTDLPPTNASYSACAGAPFLWYNPNDLYALDVTFNAAYRFAQTITENYTLTVKAPQSITQYGLIEWDQEHGLSTDYDATVWEKNEVYQTPTGLTFDANDYYIDKDNNGEYTAAIETAINMAATKIIRSHRDTRVSFETDLRLDFDLTKTIYVNTATVKAQGKITEINHVIDVVNRFTTTTTEIALSTATGTQTADALNAPTRPTVPVIADSFSTPYLIELDLFGVGDIATPDIDDTSRNEQVVTASETLNVEINNDTFEVIF